MVQILIEVLSTFCLSLRQGFNYKCFVFKLSYFTQKNFQIKFRFHKSLNIEYFKAFKSFIEKK
jgi:hypothetical protein